MKIDPLRHSAESQLQLRLHCTQLERQAKSDRYRNIIRLQRFAEHRPDKDARPELPRQCTAICQGSIQEERYLYMKTLRTQGEASILRMLPTFMGRADTLKRSRRPSKHGRGIWKSRCCTNWIFDCDVHVIRIVRMLVTTIKPVLPFSIRTSESVSSPKQSMTAAA